MKRLLAGAALGAALASIGSAHATNFISGQLDMGNVLGLYQVTVLDKNNKPVDNNLSTGVELKFAKGPLGVADFGVYGKNGSLDKIDVLGVGNVGYLHSPLFFNPLPGPISNFFSVTNILNKITVSFDLDSLKIDKQDAATLSLTGFGTLYETGYAPTRGEWDFTTNAGAKTKYTLSWSGEAFPVPEPSGIALFGVAGVVMAGLGMKRRNRPAS